MTSREELVRRAGQLVPVLQERAEQTESLRRIPEETVDDMISAGLLRIATPERFGGHGLEFDVLLDVTFELGRGCGSSAWCYAIWSSDSWYVGMFPERAQQEFWSDSADTLCASSFNPTQGNVTEVQGGYSLSGHWDFASGCDAARWILVTAVAKAGPVMFLVPRSDFTIEDIWHVSGLRGTGSNDIIIQDAVVPDYRALLVADLREACTPGRELHSTMGYRAPMLSLEVYVIDAPIVGMAKGALEAFESSMSRKISEMRGGSVSESAAIQICLAEAAVEIEAAHLIMQHDAHEILDQASRDEMLSVEERIRYRRNQAYIATLCVRAVNRLFDASGGHALFDSDPMQRFHRDTHAGSHQAVVSWHARSEQYGRVRLGLEPTDQRF